MGSLAVEIGLSKRKKREQTTNPNHDIHDMFCFSSSLPYPITFVTEANKQNYHFKLTPNTVTAAASARKIQPLPSFCVLSAVKLVKQKSKKMEKLIPFCPYRFE